jgi:putative ABC transport system ATP-binding protein
MLDLPKETLAATLDAYKIYETGGLETVALRGVTVRICEGEITAVVGPSGAGKTTLLKILGGVLRPTAGTVYWSDCPSDVSKLSSDLVVRTRQRFAGFVFQESNLLPHLTVLQNVKLAAQVAGTPKSNEKANYLLDRVGLGDRTGSLPHTLSSGQRQRVAIAGALINNPKLVLADEPTGNVDFDTGEKILDLFQELNEETGTAFFIVTHSQQVASRASRILEIRDGVLVGSHKLGADVKDLDKSRILNLDSFNRLTIPSYLLNQLDSPNRFIVETENGEIILRPCHDENVTSITVCRACGRIVKEKSNSCPYCKAPFKRQRK